jgi:hypothetical protein
MITGVSGNACCAKTVDNLIPEAFHWYDFPVISTGNNMGCSA